MEIVLLASANGAEGQEVLCQASRGKTIDIITDKKNTLMAKRTEEGSGHLI